MENIKPYIKKIKKNVKYQNIGGKKILIEKDGYADDLLDIDIKTMPIAMSEFILRRADLVWNPFTKIFYGHVIKTNLGYFVAEDELE